MGRREGESKEERRQRRLEKKEKKVEKKERKAKRKLSQSPTPSSKHPNDLENEQKKSKNPKIEENPSLIEADDNIQIIATTTLEQNDNEQVHDTSTESPIDDDVDISHSPFQMKKARLLLSLLPAALRDIHKAKHKAMESLLLKYSDGFGGVLLSFENIQIDKEQQSDNSGSTNKKGAKPYGRILNEMPHIHYYITADILVFNPALGRQLTGMVNEVFPSHIGFLVHDLFNAMVNAEPLRKAGFSYDADLNEWTHTNSSETVVVNIGDRMKLTSTKLHEVNGIISLECENPQRL